MTDTTEVRVTSESGASKGSKLARFDLIPAGPLRELAVHYGKGAEKYEPVNGIDNWRNGYDWSLTVAALHRHLNAFQAGEDYDEETGSKHIIAVAWHAFTLAYFMDHPDLVERFDNRQDTPAVDARRLIAAGLSEAAAVLGEAFSAPVEAAPAAPSLAPVTQLVPPTAIVTEVPDFVAPKPNAQVF